MLVSRKCPPEGELPFPKRHLVTTWRPTLVDSSDVGAHAKVRARITPTSVVETFQPFRDGERS